jgi:hypothetical protein
MKKILSFIIILASVIFLSCDSSNNPADVKAIALKANINGVPLYFDTVKVKKENVVPTNGNPPYTDLIVTLTISGDATKRVIIRLADKEIGTETCYYFVYTGDLDPRDPNYIGTDYQYVRRFDRDKFSIDITENSENTLKGVFSGKLLNFNSEPILVSEGSFDIKY